MHSFYSSGMTRPLVIPETSEQLANPADVDRIELRGAAARVFANLVSVVEEVERGARQLYVANIVADPGGGKTLLLRKLGRAALFRAKSVIPIYLSFKSYGSRWVKFSSYLADYASSYYLMIAESSDWGEKLRVLKDVVSGLESVETGTAITELVKRLNEQGYTPLLLVDDLDYVLALEERPREVTSLVEKLCTAEGLSAMRDRRYIVITTSTVPVEELLAGLGIVATPAGVSLRIRYTEDDVKELIAYYCPDAAATEQARMIIKAALPPRLVIRYCLTGRVVKPELVDSLLSEIERTLFKRVPAKWPERLRMLLKEHLFYIDRTLAEKIATVFGISGGDLWTRVSRVLQEMHKYGVLERLMAGRYIVKREIILAAALADERPYLIDRAVKSIAKCVEDVREARRIAKRQRSGEN